MREDGGEGEEGRGVERREAKGREENEGGEQGAIVEGVVVHDELKALNVEEVGALVAGGHVLQGELDEMTATGVEDEDGDAALLVGIGCKELDWGE